MNVEVPPVVASATAAAEAAGFTLSCEPEVGSLLSVLAAVVPPNGRILELGTGAGVGLAWLAHGLGSRRDVELITVEVDEDIQALARGLPWPLPVRFETGDGADLVSQLGRFNLVFADAPGGKIFKLRRTIEALEPGGVLVVDDMDLSLQTEPQLREALSVVRDRLVSNDELLCAEMPFSSGVILAAKLRATSGSRVHE